jgi:acetyl esterase/lipase
MNVNWIGLCSMLLVCVAEANAAETAHASKDVVYASVGGKPLALDLYIPVGSHKPPLVVYVHGGAWTTGSKAQYPAFLVEHGFAVASLDFRSSTEARFPANVHDIKAGIRFLRAKASEFGYRADRIAIVGASSGGHLAALVGVTNGDKELEGTEGDYLEESSAVQAVVSYFGASNLTTILSQSTPAGLEVREPALQRLLGASPNVVPELTRLASPVFHVNAHSPPLFLLHGDQDTQMPVNQALELQSVYESAGRPVEVLFLHGVGHVGEPFFTGSPVDRVVAFLHRNIG